MAALIAAGMVATVAAAPAQARDPRGENRSLYSINQPVVQRTDFVLDLSAASGNLSVLERGRLRAWFASLDLGYGDRIFVDEPYGPGGGTADVARVAGEFGLLVSDGVPVTVGPVDPRSVRVIVSRSTASVPGCPNWRGASVNTTSANYGCATNSNLAAMIADPSDLVLGQAGSLSVDSNAATKAIKVYRETPPSGSKGLTQTSAGGH
ncbi:MAG: pilus assembly protein CpaD [Alphaproteobacteria bacterium]|nr:pilus assembly protein CpaD [Alphaproteobacteria bacterium]MBV9370514.1 pilus assembly protein CpaD [Alphaproteobacteria bacterium]MBV9901415.1 pilus assembly protein CpaD [Alphaproteobacteria bacterium]